MSHSQPRGALTKSVPGSEVGSLLASSLFVCPLYRSPFRPSYRLQHLCCIASHLPIESGMPQRPKQCVTAGTHGPFSKRHLNGIADKTGRHVRCDRSDRALGVFHVFRTYAIVLYTEFHASRALAYPKGYSYVRRCEKVHRRSSGLPQPLPGLSTGNQA